MHIGVAILILIGLLFAGPGPLSAQQTGAPDPTPLDLQKVEQELEDARKIEALTEAQRDKIEADTQKLREELVSAGQRMKAQEAALTLAEARLQKLSQEEALARDTLRTQQAKLSVFIGAVQSLQRGQPPALLVAPGDAASAVRNAILLGDIIPRLNEQADQVRQDLANLHYRQKTLAKGQLRMRAAEKNLSQERAQLDVLLSRKTEQAQALGDELIQEQTRIAALAQKAQTLKGLIARLDEGTFGLRPTTKPGGTIAAARFSQARGRLQLPANGTIQSLFGAKDKLGQKLQGLKIATASRAQVITPFDGKVVYAGPFLDHEQLLLIEAGEGYHILLSGMARIYGQVGDRLLAGEPVGVMGDTTDNPNESLKGDGDQPVLYLEFRKDGDPINPMPWMAKTAGKVRG